MHSGGRRRSQGEGVCARVARDVRRLGAAALATLLVALSPALLGAGAGAEGTFGEAEIAELILPPFSLGERLGEDEIWRLHDSGGGGAGYVFQTRHIASIPGFSGAPVNLLVTIDDDGTFLDVQILEQNEPVFVSGLGPEPFHAFVRQYRGHSGADSISVGVPYGDAERETSTNVYLDGVTKGTASVRIANETVLAATRQVVRRFLQGVAGGPAARPDPDHHEALDWEALVEEGIARRLTLSNADTETAFAGTLFEDDDPEAAGDPEGLYLDLVVVDLGPPSVARAILDPRSLEELAGAVREHEEPILLLANGRHRLVADDFVPNTSPDRIAAVQDELPAAVRDAYVDVRLVEGVPEFEQAMVLRIDRRLGFDPSRPWRLDVRAVREHGSFRPEKGAHDFGLEYAAPERFFLRPSEAVPPPPWLQAIQQRRGDLVALALLLGLAVWALLARMRRISTLRAFPALRMGFLVVTVGFIGWWGQGQLSIVTALGVLRTAIEDRSYAFLLYDPFSLLLWAVTLVSLLVWGRGFFCGWLCPYGAMQELTHAAGRALRVPERRVRGTLDRRLKLVKYLVLAVLVGAACVSATLVETMAEVEPFKTAVTMLFVREWHYVAYAVAWLVLGVFVFKAFCRYVCPLGALLALGGRLRRWAWIERRAECGAPCQLCAVRCRYEAIERSGAIDYQECFQCLDCVAIHADDRRCAPLVVAGKRARRRAEGAVAVVPAPVHLGGHA